MCRQQDRLWIIARLANLARVRLRSGLVFLRGDSRIVSGGGLACKTANVTGVHVLGAATARKLKDAGLRASRGRRVQRVEADLASLRRMDEIAARLRVERRRAGAFCTFQQRGAPLGRFRSGSIEDEDTVLHTTVDGVLR